MKRQEPGARIQELRGFSIGEFRLAIDALYKDSLCHRWIVIPTRKLTKNTSFTHEVEVLKKSGLAKLVINVKRFTDTFKGFDFKDLAERKIQELMDTHELSVDDMCSKYTESVLLEHRR